MPPIKNNPKFKKWQELSEKEDVAHANAVLKKEFIEETKKDAELFVEWVNLPKRLLNNFKDGITFIAVLGGMYYLVKN